MCMQNRKNVLFKYHHRILAVSKSFRCCKKFSVAIQSIKATKLPGITIQNNFVLSTNVNSNPTY